LLVSIAFILALSLVLAPYINAVHAWTLFVDLTESAFGVSKATAVLKGPFGYTDRETTPTGPSASVIFNVPESAVPIGYQFEVCASGGIISTLISNCHKFTRTSDDMSVWLSVGN
jgi:hypothetical protein